MSLEIFCSFHPRFVQPSGRDKLLGIFAPEHCRAVDRVNRNGEKCTPCDGNAIHNFSGERGDGVGEGYKVIFSSLKNE